MKHWLQWLNKSGLFLFLREIIRDPQSIGAAIPSSKSLATAMAHCLEDPVTGLVVELGGGTGVVTAALLEEGVPPHQLIVIERSESLCKHLREKFPEITVLLGDAVDLATLLKPYSIPVSAVVSSLPLRLVSDEVGKKIAKAIQTVLSPKGRYIQFTYSWRHTHPHLPKELEHESSQVAWMNLPPARIDVFTHKDL